MATVGIPLTGVGGSTADVATDLVGGAHYQSVKLFDGTVGSSRPIAGLATTPGAADGGLVVRPIGSTAFNQAVVGSVGLTSGSSEVALTSVGSTKLVGQVTIANPTTAVTVSSGVILAAGSSANVLGSVTLSSVTTAITVGSVALLAGSSANMLGQVVQGAGSSANIMGQVVQGPGSSANFWFTQSIPFSSGNAARTTVNTSVDVSVIAANAARKALIVASLSTSQVVALGLTTAAVTTALGGVSLYLQPAQQVTFGLSGGMPLFVGPVRGINITSTAVAGGVAVTEFT